jgi:FKBP-type peptidyl-prolyl cis-trans isomerase FklB
MKWMAVLGVGLLAAQASAGEPQVLQTEKEKMSYAVGVDTGRNLRQLETEVDLDLLIKGVKDGLSGEKLLMTEKELWATRNATQKEMRRKQTAERQKKASTRKMPGEDNKKAGEAFLAENKAKDGVVALPSGLQYKIVKAGDGRKPMETDTVECHYRGTLIDGTVFDSSYARGKPSTFKITGVIPGWREAIKLMPVGSKWELFIPPHLAYGEKGAGRNIGPNATLIFEVELVSVTPAE